MASRDYSLSKLYVGNLPMETTEKMFADHLAKVGDLDMNRVAKIIVKKGYGFIECTDQITSDLIIDKFHSAPFYGAVLSIEPAVPASNGARELPVRVVFSATEPQDITEDDVRDIISQWGGQTVNIQRRADITGTHGGSVAFIATLEKGQNGEDLVNRFNGTTTKAGVRVKVKIVGFGRPPRSGNGERDNEPNGPSRSRSFTNGTIRSAEFPLRILVPSEMVGAIIGKGGATIRDLTMACDARVDILKLQPLRNFNGSDKAEKIITIIGTPENSTKACRKILEILVEDVSSSKANSEADVSLRLLAYNSLIGRVIGKSGANIRKIMQDTQTKIQVSNQTEYQTTSWHGFRDSDRIITIRGSIDGMSNAEAMVTAKLRLAFDADYQAKMGRGGRNFAPTGTRSGIPYDDLLLARPFDWLPLFDLPPSVKSETTTTYLYVPHHTVGCLIGTKGSTVREMNRASQATIKIEKIQEGNGNNNPENPQGERRVTIIGPAEAHIRAQWLIFERLRSSGLIQSAGELKFTVEMPIPSKFVGRLIGKAGARIQELQQQTLTTIKFLRVDPYSADIVTSHSGGGDCPYTLARIHGTGMHVLTAESKLRNCIHDFTLQANRMSGAYQPANNLYYVAPTASAPTLGTVM